MRLSFFNNVNISVAPPTGDDARILLVGQSNALGVGNVNELDNSYPYLSPFSRVFIFNPKNNTYENLHVAENNQSANDADYVNPIIEPLPWGCFGPELGIAVWWMQSTTGGNLYIDKNTLDGQPIAQFVANYNVHLARKNNADAWLSANGTDPEKIGFVWVQGEGDMFNTQSYYFNALNDYIDSLQSGGFIDYSTKRVITQCYPGTGNYSAAIAAAKEEYVAIANNTFMAYYPNMFNSDNVHLNAAGQLELSSRSVVHF